MNRLSCATFSFKEVGDVKIIEAVFLRVRGVPGEIRDDGTTYHKYTSMINLPGWTQHLDENGDLVTYPHSTETKVTSIRGAGTVYYGPLAWTTFVIGHFDENQKPIPDKAGIDFSNLGPESVLPLSCPDGVYKWERASH
jgi:hypothetical protein